jgi:hypothetical protein
MTADAMSYKNLINRYCRIGACIQVPMDKFMGYSLTISTDKATHGFNRGSRKEPNPSLTILTV